MGEIQQKADAEGLKPTKYVLGGEEETGHTHVFYLRDDLPIATTAEPEEEGATPHAHTITEGPGKTLGVNEVLGHTHTKLVVEERGNYEPRSLFGV